MNEDKIARRLDRLYPGLLALLLQPLCGPTCPECPEGKRGKRPSPHSQRGWNEKALQRLGDGTDRDAHIRTLAKYRARGGNIGLVIPDGVCVVDADDPAAVEVVRRALPGAVCQQTGKGAHFLARIPPGVKLLGRARCAYNGVQLDMRTPGQQIVVEPSLHEVNPPGYLWDSELPQFDQLHTLPVLPNDIARVFSEASKTTRTRSGAPAGAINGLDDLKTRLRSHGCEVRRSSAQCPAHDDRQPSLAIHEKDGRILIYCHAGCSPEAVVAALGLTMADLFIDREHESGGRERGVSEEKRVLAYLRESSGVRTVHLHESERGAEVMRKRGSVAICVPGWTLTSTLIEALKGKDLVLWVNRDASSISKALGAYRRLQK